MPLFDNREPSSMTKVLATFALAEQDLTCSARGEGAMHMPAQSRSPTSRRGSPEMLRLGRQPGSRQRRSTDAASPHAAMRGTPSFPQLEVADIERRLCASNTPGQRPGVCLQDFAQNWQEWFPWKGPRPVAQDRFHGTASSL